MSNESTSLTCSTCPMFKNKQCNAPGGMCIARRIAGTGVPLSTYLDQLKKEIADKNEHTLRVLGLGV